MKQLMIMVLLTGLFACDDGGSKAADEPTTSATSASASADTADPPAAPEVLDHDDLMKQGAALEGKAITVKAVSWGTSARTDGVQLNLGPKKLTGMQQAKLVAFFPKGAEQDRFEGMKGAVQKDAEVTLACKVGEKSHGARRLLECKVP